MKVMVFVKATPNSEAGIMPKGEQMQKLFTAMSKYNERLVKAGILRDGDGLKPSSAGKRIQFSDDGATSVIDGPFAETKELIAGYWVWEVKSLAEAIKWARRCPNPMPGEEGVLEVRPFYTMEDFAPMLTDEQVANEARLRKQVTRSKAGSAESATRKPKRAKSKRAKSKK